MSASTRSILTSARAIRAGSSAPSAPPRGRRWLITPAPSYVWQRGESSRRAFASSVARSDKEGERSDDSPYQEESTPSSSSSAQRTEERSPFAVPQNGDADAGSLFGFEDDALTPTHRDGVPGRSLSSMFGDLDDDKGDFLGPFGTTSRGESTSSQQDDFVSQRLNAKSEEAGQGRNPFADLFEGPDAFPKADRKKEPQKFAMGGMSKRFRTATGEPFSEFVGRRGTSRDKARSVNKLSPSERQQWMRVLGNVTEVFSNKRVSQFAGRNDLQLNDNAKKRSLGGTISSRLASLREGISTQISPDALEKAVDEAKQEMNSKAHEAELWEWAIKNVWGFDEQALREALHQGSAVARKSPNSAPSWAIAAPYGMHTPYYAPVLHRLLCHFRDRLRTPNSALAVLRITRALGPESSVLGCTPELYTEAMYTTYFVMQDLRGSLLLLQEARELGVLVDAVLEQRAVSSMGGPGQNSTYHPRSLPGMLQTIQADVSNRTLGMRAAVQAKEAQRLQEQNDSRRWSDTASNTADSKQSASDNLLDEMFDRDSLTDDLDEPQQQQQQQQSPPRSKSNNHDFRVDLESLTLPALDALRIVEEMNTILYATMQRVSPSQLPNQSNPADATGFGFSDANVGSAKNGKGGRGYQKWKTSDKVRSSKPPPRKAHLFQNGTLRSELTR